MKFALALLLIALPALSLAHGSGVSLEATVDGKVIDVGYDPEVLVAGERVVFDFTLYDETKTTEIPFDRAWVRVEGDGAVLLSTGVGKAYIGPSTLLMHLPNPVPHATKLHVRFEEKGKPLASTSFDLAIQPAETPLIHPLSALMAGIVTGAGIVGALWAARSRLKRSS